MNRGCQLKSAVILAAGIGSRLSPITNNIPKCCIRVKNKPIIVRITDQLLSCDGKMNINIVVGHLSDKVRDEMANYPDIWNIKTRTKWNPAESAWQKMTS